MKNVFLKRQPGLPGQGGAGQGRAAQGADGPELSSCCCKPQREEPRGRGSEGKGGGGRTGGERWTNIRRQVNKSLSTVVFL